MDEGGCAVLIGEIAIIAQVSSRAIRHYHRAGVLPEPERAPNGYRVYSVLDLTRLLRIRRLIGLGLPLHRIGVVLRTEPEDMFDEFDALESDLIEQIERMRQQLASIRAARASSSPEAVALYDSDHEAVRDLWSVPEVRRVERDVGLLLISAGDEHLRETLRAGFTDPARLTQLGELSAQLRAIDEHSSQADRDELVTTLGGIVAEWTDLEVRPQLHRLVNDYLEQVFTVTQLDIIARATARSEEVAAQST